MDTETAPRALAFRRARIAVLALVVVYFFLPYDVRAWIPVWLPFLALLALEAQFFVGGWLDARRGRIGRTKVDRGPQPHDVEELGGERWWEPESLEEPDEEPEPEEDEHEEELEPEEPSRPNRRYVLEALAVLALVAGILFFASRPRGWDAVSAADRARAEALFSQEGSRIAGHRVRIGCDTSGRRVGFVQDTDGVAVVGGTQAYLTPAICDTLHQLAFKDRVRSFSRTGRAIAVLAHEGWHLRGVRDEGTTECYALQSGVDLGVRLGLSEREARRLMRQQLAENATRGAGSIEYVVPRECRDGGALDLHPSRSAFP